jgi:hypothetical protein
LQKKIKPKIQIVPVFARKKTLIDVDCTQKKTPVGCNLVVKFGLQLGCKKTYGWLFSPH